MAARDAGVTSDWYMRRRAPSTATVARLPQTEERTGTLLSPYAVTNRQRTSSSRRYFSGTYGLEIVGLRYFNVFGPRQDPDGPYAAVVPRWATSLIRGTTLPHLR